MPIMKEIWTPLKWLGIRYFKDEKGTYYRKIGSRHRRKVRPLWKKKTVLFGVPFLLFLAFGWFGYRVAMNIASEKMMNEIASQISEKEISTLLQDPNVQQLVKKELGSEEAQKLLQIQPNETKKSETNQASGTNKKPTATKQETTPTNPSPSNEQQPVNEPAEKSLMFHSRDEAMKFLLSKFSMSELMSFAEKAKDGLTPEEKAEIKETVTKRLTPAEYNALKVYAFIELSKQSQ